MANRDVSAAFRCDHCDDTGEVLEPARTPDEPSRMIPCANCSAACMCDGPLRNVTVDGNAGHSPGCPSNPNTWPEGLRVCKGCGIPFSEPVTPEYALTVFPSLDVAGFVCETCDVG